MARSVILAGTERCEHCHMAPRWCICSALQPVTFPLQVDVLIHRREHWRPTSTGKLIRRVVSGANNHVYDRNIPVVRETIVNPNRTLWILHPKGELPAPDTMPAPQDVQVLLLDGNWNEAGEMLRNVETWGRCVRLPMEGESRYWLRDQQDSGRFSTVEALLHLMSAIGLHEAAAQVRLHFELHVYATLRARGKKPRAEEYLANSPIKSTLPEFLERIRERRPNPAQPREKPARPVTSRPEASR